MEIKAGTYIVYHPAAGCITCLTDYTMQKWIGFGEMMQITNPGASDQRIDLIIFAIAVSHGLFSREVEPNKFILFDPEEAGITK